jgi:hypothetical protein
MVIDKNPREIINRTKLLRNEVLMLCDKDILN